MLCCAVLCCAVLCCAVLCCAVLCVLWSCRKNVVTYFNHYVKDIAAKDPAAVAKANISPTELQAIKEGFQVDSNVSVVAKE
jgi:hypothetical protein